MYLYGFMVMEQRPRKRTKNVHFLAVDIMRTEFNIFQICKVIYYAAENLVLPKNAEVSNGFISNVDHTHVTNASCICKCFGH